MLLTNKYIIIIIINNITIINIFHAIFCYFQLFP